MKWEAWYLLAWAVIGMLIACHAAVKPDRPARRRGVTERTIGLVLTLGLTAFHASLYVKLGRP